MEAGTVTNSGTMQGGQSLQVSGKQATNRGTLLSDGQLTM
ncbi:hypothetical protein, partial [Erwinia sp.]